MTASTHGLNELVVQAVAAVEYLRIDTDRLDPQLDYFPISGGFGTVRVSKFGDELVAVKQLHVPGDRVDRARFVTRFARELKVWAPLDHPNILKLYGFYLSPEMLTAEFISPYCLYGHIGSYLDQHSPDRSKRYELARDTALGLQYLHELKIAHGDLKEANVLVDSDVRAILCDYGLAKMVDDENKPSGLTTTKNPMSARFASPELINGSPRTLSSDIWAWACLFLKIVEGKAPYMDAPTDFALVLSIAKGDLPADVSSLNLHESLRIMLLLCWDRDPSARPKIARCVEIIDSVRSPRELVQEAEPKEISNSNPDSSAEFDLWALPSFDTSFVLQVLADMDLNRDQGVEVDSNTVPLDPSERRSTSPEPAFASPSSDMEAFRLILAQAKSVIILAGAGLSAASGIPTFKGAGRTWRGYNAIDLATPESFAADPSLVWQFYHDRRETALAAQPNAAHESLAALNMPGVLARLCPSLLPENSPPLFITQNVDGISRRTVGILPREIRNMADVRLWEMHGSIFSTRCGVCEATKREDSNPLCSALGEAQLHHGSKIDIPLEDLPRCSAHVRDLSGRRKCGELLRPDVVWFGELPMYMDMIEAALIKCELLLVVGTSSRVGIIRRTLRTELLILALRRVYPAAGFASRVKTNGGKVAVFNLERSFGDSDANFLFLGPCEETLPLALGLNLLSVFEPDH